MMVYLYRASTAGICNMPGQVYNGILPPAAGDQEWVTTPGAMPMCFGTVYFLNSLSRRIFAQELTCCRSFRVHLEAQQSYTNKVCYLCQHKQRVMVFNGPAGATTAGSTQPSVVHSDYVHIRKVKVEVKLHAAERVHDGAANVPP